MCPKYILPLLTYLVLVSTNTYPVQYPNVHQNPPQWLPSTYPQFNQMSPQFGNYIGAGLTPNYVQHPISAPGYQQQYTMPYVQPNMGSMYPPSIQTYPNGYGGIVPDAMKTGYGQFPGSASYPGLFQPYQEMRPQFDSRSVYPELHQTQPEISVKISDAPTNFNPENQRNDTKINGLNWYSNLGRDYQALPQVIGENNQLMVPQNQQLPEIKFENRYPALESLYPHTQTHPDYSGLSYPGNTGQLSTGVDSPNSDSRTFTNFMPALESIQTYPDYSGLSFPGNTHALTSGGLDIPNSGSKTHKNILPSDIKVPMIKHCPEYLKRYLEQLKIAGKLEYAYSKTVDVNIIDICMPQKSGVVYFDDNDTELSYEDSTVEVDPE